MSEGQRSGSLRYATSIAVLVVTLALVGCGTLTLLPHQTSSSANVIKSFRELAAAYARVEAGTTRASQLARLGFDSSMPNAEVLSYLGVMERFATVDTTRFDRLDDALQNCIETRDRCTALVFKSADQLGSVSGGVFAALGFGGAAAASHVPEVTLLVQNGRVAYKMITGLPRTAAARRPAAAAPSRAATAAMPVAYRSLY